MKLKNLPITAILWLSLLLPNANAIKKIKEYTIKNRFITGLGITEDAFYITGRWNQKFYIQKRSKTDFSLIKEDTVPIGYREAQMYSLIHLSKTDNKNEIFVWIPQYQGVSVIRKYDEDLNLKWERIKKKEKIAF